MTIAIATTPQVDGLDVERSYGALALHVLRAGPLPRRIRDAIPACDGLAVLLARAGAATIADASGVRSLVEGEALVLDPATRLSLRLDAGAELAVLLVPASLARTAGVLPGALSGRRADAGDGRVLLLAAVVDGLLALPTAASSMRAARLAEHAVGLLAWSVEPGDRPAHSRDALARAAKDTIEANLKDVDLSPDTVARALNVSTRTLHRSLEADGTSAGGWIRLRRLERCRADLVDPALSAEPVSAIGARWGLCDAAHLSRSFKEAFGLSPRAYRQLHLGHDCGVACHAA